MSQAGLALLTLGLAAGGGLLLAIWRRERAKPQLTAELRFCTDVSEPAVRAVLSAISGMPLTNRLTFEVVSDTAGIRHLMRGERTAIAALGASIAGLLPGCQLVPLDDEVAYEPADHTHGLRLRFRGPGGHLLLRTDQTQEAATGLLAAMSGPLGREERLLLRLVVRPSRVPRLPEKSDGVDPSTHLAGWFGLSLSAPPENCRTSAGRKMTNPAG